MRPTLPVVSSLPAIAAPWLPSGVGDLLLTHSPRAYLPFQISTLAHEALITLSVAFARLGPILEEPSEGKVASEAGTEAEKVTRQLQNLEQWSGMNGVEANRLLGLDIAPFRGEPEAAQTLREQIQDWLVTNTIRNDQDVQKAVRNVVSRRQAEAEHNIDRPP